MRLSYVDDFNYESGKIPDERFITNSLKHMDKVCLLFRRFCYRRENLFLSKMMERDRVYKLKKKFEMYSVGDEMIAFPLTCQLRSLVCPQKRCHLSVD